MVGENPGAVGRAALVRLPEPVMVEGRKGKWNRGSLRQECPNNNHVAPQALPLRHRAAGRCVAACAGVGGGAEPKSCPTRWIISLPLSA